MNPATCQPGDRTAAAIEIVSPLLRTDHSIRSSLRGFLVLLRGAIAEPIHDDDMECGPGDFMATFGWDFRWGLGRGARMLKIAKSPMEAESWFLGKALLAAAAGFLRSERPRPPAAQRRE